MRRKSKKTTFIRNTAEIKKDFLPVVGGMVLRNGAAAGTGALSKVLEGEKIPKVVKQIKPWAFLVMGAAGELLVKNPYVNSVAAGMNTYGFIEAINVASPTVAEKMGMPLNPASAAMKGIGATKNEIDDFFEQIANETAAEFTNKDTAEGYAEKVSFEGVEAEEGSTVIAM